MTIAMQLQLLQVYTQAALYSSVEFNSMSMKMK